MIFKTVGEYTKKIPINDQCVVNKFLLFATHWFSGV